MVGEDSLATPPDRPESDRGFTFVETVLTIVLIGIVVVPVLAAVRGAVQVSRTSKDAAEIQTVLINAADRVQRADGTECDYTSYAQNAAATAGWPTSDIEVSQEYLRVSDGTWVEGSACPDGDPAQRVASRITITASSSDGALRRSIQVVKTDV
jgi:type II secretory pathway pseudopilin PulG